MLRVNKLAAFQVWFQRHHLIRPCVESRLPVKFFNCHFYCPHLLQKQLALDLAIRLEHGSQAVDMAQSPLAFHDQKCLLSKSACSLLIAQNKSWAGCTEEFLCFEAVTDRLDA